MTSPALVLPTWRPGLHAWLARAAGRLALSIAILGGTPLLARAAGPLDGLIPGLPHAAPAATHPASTTAPAAPGTATAATPRGTPAGGTAAGGTTVGATSAAAPAANAAISPADAQRALELLQDDATRAQTVRALKAIADTARGTPAAGQHDQAGAPTPATTAPPATAATPAAPPTTTPATEAPPSTIVPLEANGLMARVLRSISDWGDGVSAQVQQVRAGMKTVPDLVARANHSLSTEAGQRLLRHVLTTLIAVFAVGLLLEWGLKRALRQPRDALAHHADEEQAAERRQHREEERQRAQAERQRQEAERQQEREQHEAEDASLRAAPPGVAVVQTTRDGIARVEAVPVPLEDGAAPRSAGPAGTGATDTAALAPAPTAAPADAATSTPTPTPTPTPANQTAAPASAAQATTTTATARATAAAAVVAEKDAGAAAALPRFGDSAGPPDGRPATGSDTVATGGAAGVITRDAYRARATASEKASRNAGRHWHTVRHLPYALASLILDLLPLALFVVAAALVLHWLDGDDPRVHDAVSGFIHAYVTARISMAIVRLLVSPVGHGLRVLHLSDPVSQKLLSGLRRIIVLALFGLALADMTEILGVGATARAILLKGISLLVHIFAIVLILQLRRPVARIIAGKSGQKGALGLLRHWLAHTWAVIAIVLVAGIWIVWALGVEDGFPKLMHFVVVTGGVIIVARIVAMMLLGALGRLFQAHPTQDDDKDEANRSAAQERLAGRYFPLVRGLVTALMFIVTALVLLEVWGADVLDWFAQGTLGRSMASALSTIAVSVVIAIVVWEAVHIAIERRLQRWKDQGDLLRAARLRTLLPMLRTLLLIAVILVVGLTALNEIGINTTPLLAGASIIGVAVGFGSQKLVQDFITGIFLLMENAMQVGDWVTVAGVSGSVEYLSIRTVRLRGGDGSLYIVPFSSVSTVNNTNRGLGNAAVRVSVDYDTDVERVIAELKKLGAEMREDPAYRNVILNDIEVWGVDAVDGSMVTLAGQIRCKDSGRWGVQREMNRRILNRFRDLGIAIANPRASLLLKADETPADMPEPDGPAPRGQGRETSGPRS